MNYAIKSWIQNSVTVLTVEFVVQYNICPWLQSQCQHSLWTLEMLLYGVVLHVLQTKFIIFLKNRSEVLSDELYYSYCYMLWWSKGFRWISKSKMSYFFIRIPFSSTTCVFVSQQSQHHIAKPSLWATDSRGSI